MTSAQTTPSHDLDEEQIDTTDLLSFYMEQAGLPADSDLPPATLRLPSETPSLSYSSSAPIQIPAKPIPTKSPLRKASSRTGSSTTPPSPAILGLKKPSGEGPSSWLQLPMRRQSSAERPSPMRFSIISNNESDNEDDGAEDDDDDKERERAREDAGPLDVSTLLTQSKSSIPEDWFKSASKMKKVCRQGIPDEARPHVWPRLVLSNPDLRKFSAEDYEQLIAEVFPDGRIPQDLSRIVPDFGNPVAWATQGTASKLDRTTQKLLCLIAHNNGAITHCPYLVDFIPLLLSRIPEQVVFQMVQSMLDQSKRTQRYFTLSGKSFAQRAAAFAVYVKSKAKDVDKVLSQFGVDCAKLFSTWVSRFFVHTFHHSLIYRIVDCFLNEGGKILYRVALAALKLHVPKLSKIKNRQEFESRLAELLLTSHGSDEALLKIAFNLRLRRRHIALTEKQQELMPRAVPTAKQQVFHVPRFVDKKSDLFSFHHLCVLWSWLPDSFRINDARLLFSTSTHGYSLQTMLDIIGDDDVPHFIILRESEGQVFGIFVLQCWKKGKEEQGRIVDGRSFAFSLMPREEAFHSTIRAVQDCADEHVVPTLHVKVHRGKALASMDRFSESDPYLVIETLDGNGNSLTSTKTPAFDDEPNPEFGYSEDLYDTLALIPNTCAELRWLRIQVWDKDPPPLPDELIGEVLLDLQTMDNQTLKGWRTLSPSQPRPQDGPLPSSSALGQVEIEVHYQSIASKLQEHDERASKIQAEFQKQMRGRRGSASLPSGLSLLPPAASASTSSPALGSSPARGLTAIQLMAGKPVEPLSGGTSPSLSASLSFPTSGLSHSPPATGALPTHSPSLTPQYSSGDYSPGDSKRRVRGSFMSRTEDSIALGDASGVALSLDGRLKEGRSQPTVTYGNPPLSSSTDADGRFVISAVEVWVFDQAK